MGENNYNLYSALLNENTVKVNLPDYNVDYEAEISNFTRSYVSPLDEHTIANFSFNLSEKTDEFEWTMYHGLVQTAISNWARTRALAKILVDKNLITTEEYEKLITEIYESDFEEMRNFIFKGE